MKTVLTVKNIVVINAVIAITILSGCVLMPREYSTSKYNIAVGLYIKSETNKVYVKKANSLFQNCIPYKYRGRGDTKNYFDGMSCDFEKNIPNNIEFQYLVGLSDDETQKKYYGKEITNKTTYKTEYFDLNGNKVSLEQWYERGEQKENQAIMSLPQSAWKTYKIDVKSILKKYRGVRPKGTPIIAAVPIGIGAPIGSPFKSLINQRYLAIGVDISKNGVNVEEHLSWANRTMENFTY